MPSHERCKIVKGEQRRADRPQDDVRETSRVVCRDVSDIEGVLIDFYRHFKSTMNMRYRPAVVKCVVEGSGRDFC